MSDWDRADMQRRAQESLGASEKDALFERLDRQKAELRYEVDGAVARTVEAISEMPEAPEGIELYNWLRLPWCAVNSVMVICPPYPEKPVLWSIADDGVQVAKGTVITAIEPRVAGKLTVATTFMAHIDLPYWCGWDEGERVAILACGPS